MSAVFKREFRSYFRTPLGYVIVAASFFFTNYYFYTYNLFGNTTDFSKLFDMLFSVILFLVPVLTMRLLSEEKRSHTDQLLLTAPVSPIGIILGKYFAAVCVYLIAILATIIDALIASVFGRVDWPCIIGNFIGLVLLGVALISICMFLSSITESQVIAAVTGFSVGLLLTLIDAISYVVSSKNLQQLFSYLSFGTRYNPFTLGIIDFSNVVFFITVAGLFIAFSTAVLERRRWC